MPAVKDFYDILGVTRSANEKEIRQAYRKLARKYHPDVNPGDKSAEARFKEISEAYEVLSDKEKRSQYDRFGANWKQAGQQPPGGYSGSSRRPGGQTTYTDFDFGEAYQPGGDGGVGDLGGIFERLFGRGSNQGPSRRARKGQDLEQSVEITLEEAYSGTTRIVQLRAEEVCQQCEGTGVHKGGPCLTCSGRGSIDHSKRLEVKIPAGVETGSRVRVAGEGGYGSNGGVRGDMFLVVKVKPSEQYERKGNDLYRDVSVPLTTAVLGGEVEVNTLKGKVSLRIPSETPNGKVFRLKGRGMPALKGSGTGDLFARVSVALPTGLSEKERKLFEQLRMERQAN